MDRILVYRQRHQHNPRPVSPGQCFDRFQNFPQELQDKIWDLAARTLDPAVGNIHYVSIDLDQDSPVNPWVQDARIGVRVLAKAPGAAAHGGDDGGLWAACRASRDAMHRHFRTPEWAARLRAEGGAPGAEDVAFGRSFASVPLSPGGGVGGGGGRLLLRREADLVVFDGISVRRPGPAGRAAAATAATAAREYARYFPEAMLCSPPARDVTNLAFPIERLDGLKECLWQLSRFGRMFLGDLFIHKASLIRRHAEDGENLTQRWHHQFQQQLWIVDHALRVPRGFVVPGGRKTFAGDGFRLVEVRPEDYGLDRDTVNWVLSEADEDACVSLLGTGAGDDYGDLTSLSDELPRALDEVAAFQLQQLCQDDWVDALQLSASEEAGIRNTQSGGRGMDDLVREIKVLAYEPLPGARDPTTKTGGGFQHFLQRWQERSGIAGVFDDEAEP